MTLHSTRSRVTRAEAAAILGTSVSNVRRLQRKGILRSVPDLRGVHRFDRDAVVALRRQRSRSAEPNGDVTAEVFAMIKAGRSFGDIVIESRLTAEQVRTLKIQYEEGFQYRPSDPASDEEIARRVDHEVELTRAARRTEEEHAQTIEEMDAELERKRSQRRRGR